MIVKKMIGKKVLEFIFKKILESKEIQKIRKYVEEPNELDLDLINLKKEVEKLKKNSHPPIFSLNDYKKLIKRLDDLEKNK